MSKREKQDKEKQCDNCIYCTMKTIGNYICSRSNEVVMEDWQWTEHFASCQGKDFRPL